MSMKPWLVFLYESLLEGMQEHLVELKSERSRQLELLRHRRDYEDYVRDIGEEGQNSNRGGDSPPTVPAASLTSCVCLS